MEPQHNEQEVTAVPVTNNTGIPASDNSDHKLFAILGYILPFLFFLPLLNEKSKHNEFARFHANQQLILLIIGMIVYFFINTFLFMTFGYAGYMFSSLLNLAIFVLVVLGVINASQEKMVELPLVGGFKLLK